MTTFMFGKPPAGSNSQRVHDEVHFYGRSSEPPSRWVAAMRDANMKGETRRLISIQDDDNGMTTEQARVLAKLLVQAADYLDQAPDLDHGTDR